MASENIEFKVVIDGVEQEIKSLKDLKKAIKEATDEQVRASEKYGIGSKEYQKASQRVSELRDKVDDLRDSTKSLQGSGIERASAGFNQLGEGLRNLDFDKVKVGFSAMKTAIAAVGIGLFVQLIQYLYENFDKLSKGSGGLAVALRAVGDVMTSLMQVGEEVLNFITDFIGLTSEAGRAAEEALAKTEKAASEASKNLSDRLNNQNIAYNQQIALLKAAGKETIDIEKEKLKNIIETSKAIIQQLTNKKQLTEEDKKMVLEAGKAAYDAQNQLAVMEVELDKKKLDKQRENYKKHLDEKLASDKAYLDRQKQLEIEAQNAADFLAAQEEAAMKRQQAYDEELNQREQLNIYYDELRKQREAKIAEERKAKEEKDRQDRFNAELDITQKTIQALSNLNEVYFLFKKQGLQKGSAEEERIARKQFQFDKALKLASATASGFQAVQNTFTTASASPITGAFPAYPFIQAGLAGIFSAANIAKIASTQFQSSGGGGSSAPAVGGAPSVPAPPTPPTSQSGGTSTLFDQTGQTTGNDAFRVMQGGNSEPAPIKAYVVETEISQKQKDIKTITEQATF